MCNGIGRAMAAAGMWCFGALSLGGRATSLLLSSASRCPSAVSLQSWAMWAQARCQPHMLLGKATSSMAVLVDVPRYA